MCSRLNGVSQKSHVYPERDENGDDVFSEGSQSEIIWNLWQALNAMTRVLIQEKTQRDTEKKGM